MMKATLVFLALILPQSVLAFPLAKAPPTAEDYLLLPQSFRSDYDFTGIVALSNCSGSLVKLETSKASDRAFVFTNGHCLGGAEFLAPDEFVFDRPSARRFTLLKANAKEAGMVRARRVLYASMTKTDLAIYELEETFEQILRKFNIEPITLSIDPLKVGDDLDVLSGYWRLGYSCKLEKIIPTLKEDKWTFAESLRYSRPGCETIHGTSGAPVLKGGSKLMVGINNTGNDNGESCTMDNPCEVDLDGKLTAIKGYSYGQQTFWVYTCLNEDGAFDLNQKNCKLFH